MKQESGSKLQVVVQMVRMPGNAHEVDEFRRFWRRFPASIRFASRKTKPNSGAGREAPGGRENASAAVITCGAERCT